MNHYEYLIGKKIKHDNGPFIVMLFFDAKNPFLMVKDLSHNIKFIKASDYTVIE